jgi:hypothetical protein
MTVLSKRAQQWAKTCGVHPLQLNKAFDAVTLDAALVVKDEFNRVIHDIKSPSLSGYEAVIKENPGKKGAFKAGGLQFFLKSYRVYVRPSYIHRSVHSLLNVFDLIDAGRPALPAKDKDDKPYMVWGKSNVEKIPARSVRSSKTGRYGYKNDLRPTYISPPRKEPRQPRGSKFRLRKEQKRALFSRGPLRAVAPRNLYQRIFKEAQKALKRDGLPSDMITLGKKRE